VRIFRSVAFIFAFVLTCGTSARAQSFAPYAGEFLQLGVGARSLALGGAAAAVTTDATAGYWNPAGLVHLQYPNIVGMYESRFDGTVRYQYGAIALPSGTSSAFALSVFNLSLSDIKDTRSAFIDRQGNGQVDFDDYFDTSKVRTFSNHDWGIYASYARSIDSTLSYGVSAKLLLRKLEESNKATGVGVDVGVRYRPLERLVLAAVGQDITTTLISYSSGRKELVSPTLKLGAAYHLYLTADGYHQIIPVIDADLRFEDRGDVALIALGPITVDLHLGAEYRFGDLFAIRGGYSDIKAFTVGAGVQLPKLHVDYAFMSFNQLDQLGNTHRVSFSFTLEQERLKRK
jgi:hypothetical protein